MSDRPSLEEPYPEQPTVTPAVTHGPPTCCLCGSEILSGEILTHHFAADLRSEGYSVHAKCAHEYALTRAALGPSDWR